MSSADQRAVRPHLGRGVARAEVSTSPGRSIPRSTSWPKATRGSARFDPVTPAHPHPAAAPRDPASAARLAIGFLALDPDECGPASWPPPRWCPCRRTGPAPHRRGWSWPPAPGAAAPRASASDAPCRPRRVLQPLMPGAERDHPVRPHLHAVVQRLQRLVVEGVFRTLVRLAQISVSCALVSRLPRKFGIGFDLRQTTSFRSQKPASCIAAPSGRCCDSCRSPRSPRRASAAAARRPASRG
jgi:hypothetical protein